MSATDRKRVLVTRPQPQAAATAKRLRALGYDPILAPMLCVEGVVAKDPLPDTFQAFLVTSANGLIHGSHEVPRSLPVLTVGDRTEATARDLGFTDVRSASGDGVDLLALAGDLNPADGPLLYLRGEDTAISMEPLRAAGFDLHDPVVYRAMKIATLPEDAANPLPPVLLVYSARTAEALAEALTSLECDLTETTIIGISAAALAPLSNTGARLIPAKTPDEAAIFDALRVALPGSQRF